jgi:hypothetical protein
VDIHQRDAGARENLPVQPIAFPDDSQSADDEQDAGDAALNRPPRFVDPVVFDRELFEIAHADDDGDDADV